MKILLDANLPRSAAAAVTAAGHEPIDERDIAMGGSTDADIAAYARENGICLATRDFDFADVRNYPPNKYAGLIVLDLPDKAVSADVCALLTKFLLRPNVEREMAGRLAIVRPERVRFRPKLDS